LFFIVRINLHKTSSKKSNRSNKRQCGMFRFSMFVPLRAQRPRWAGGQSGQVTTVTGYWAQTTTTGERKVWRRNRKNRRPQQKRTFARATNSQSGCPQRTVFCCTSDEIKPKSEEQRRPRDETAAKFSRRAHAHQRSTPSFLLSFRLFSPPSSRHRVLA